MLIVNPSWTTANTQQGDFPAAIESRTPATDFATPASDVSAFCRAVLKNVMPKGCWGVNAQGVENEQLIMKAVDRFVHARKFESLTLHEVLDGIKVSKQSTCVSIN
jgi:telomerase reverse transcriptase